MTESSRCFDDDLSRIDAQGSDPQRSDARQFGGHPLEADEFEQCYLAYASGVRAALRGRLVNDLDVEDCLSRVFEKLWSRGQSIPPASRRAWLFVVARNEAALLGRNAGRAAGNKPGQRSQRRKDGQAGYGTSDAERASRAAVVSWDQSRLSMDPPPLESLLKDEQITRLRAAGHCLSPEQAEVLRCRFVEDLPFREIAQQLGIPLGTALSRARAAIKRLRAELGSAEDD